METIQKQIDRLKKELAICERWAGDYHMHPDARRVAARREIEVRQEIQVLMHQQELERAINV
jgi:hypothetical protein